MNDLEKLFALLSKEGRQIKYGVRQEEAEDPLVCLSMGEGESTVSSLGERGAVEFSAVVAAVYSSDYLAGYNLLSAVKSEIFSAKKETMRIFHSRDLASEYDGGKYVFKSVYKIIK